MHTLFVDEPAWQCFVLWLCSRETFVHNPFPYGNQTEQESVVVKKEGVNNATRKTTTSYSCTCPYAQVSFCPIRMNVTCSTIVYLFFSCRERVYFVWSKCSLLQVRQTLRPAHRFRYRRLMVVCFFFFFTCSTFFS